MYSENNKGPNIDPCGNPQFMVPASKKTVPNETKKILTLTSLAKWLSVRLRTKWFWVRVLLQSLEKNFPFVR